MIRKFLTVIVIISILVSTINFNQSFATNTTKESNIYEENTHRYNLLNEQINYKYGRLSGMCISIENTCLKCGKVITKEIGHKLEIESKVSPTCTDSGSVVYRCKVCKKIFNEKKLPKLKHQFEISVIKEPTCYLDGTITYSCIICNETRTQILKKLGHNYVRRVIRPTCIDYGYTIYTCSTCKKYYKTDIIEARGHDIHKSVVNGETEYYCYNCDTF